MVSGSDLASSKLFVPPSTEVLTGALFELIPVTRAHKSALAISRAQLAALLGFDVPDGWPEFPEAFDPEATGPETPDWPAYFFASIELGSVVGNGGYCGPPVAGEIEIGYEIAPAFRCRGFATAAATMLVARAFANPQIQAVIAHTLAEKNASNSVLTKLGMRLVGEFANEEVGAVWRWRRSRNTSA